MGNYKIKGFLVLVLLCSIANAQKYLNPKEEYDVADGSIYDRFVNITATEKEKEGVMSAIKEIISIAPNSTNWKHLAGVIREGKLEENIEELGGEKSRKVVKNLQYLYQNTKNMTALTAYMDACLEFMSLESLSREEKMYLFAELLGPERYQTWYKANSKVMEAMGLKKEYAFPKEQIDFLVNYWNENPVLKEGILLEKLRLADGSLLLSMPRPTAVPTLIRYLESFKKSLYPKNSSEVKNLSEFEVPDQVDRKFDTLLEPRIHVFNFSVVKSIEKELSEHPEYQSSLINQLEGKGPVLEYFAFLGAGSSARLNALDSYQSFIDAVKNTTDQQQKAFSTFLKEYISMDQSSKTTFEEVMTTDMTREKCWYTWRNQSISQKAIEMVKLVNLLDEEFGVKTCLANVIELKNTVKLSKYWNQNPALENLPTFLKILFPVDQKFKEILQTMLTDTKDLTRVSIQHLLKTLRLFVHDNLKFVEIFETIQTLHGINLEPVWMMMKQFLEFSDDNKNNYIKINFEGASLKSLGDFFKTIQKVPNVAKEFEETFLRPNEQWNKEQIGKLLELLEVLEESKYPDEVDHAFDENVSEEECDKILFSWSNIGLFDPLHDLVDSFNSAVKNSSCLKYGVPYIPD
ncbi:unnamed protein product [Caenorhabditis brenneri]